MSMCIPGGGPVRPSSVIRCSIAASSSWSSSSTAATNALVGVVAWPASGAANSISPDWYFQATVMWSSLPVTGQPLRCLRGVAQQFQAIDLDPVPPVGQSEPVQSAFWPPRRYLRDGPQAEGEANHHQIVAVRTSQGVRPGGRWGPGLLGYTWPSSRSSQAYQFAGVRRRTWRSALKAAEATILADGGELEDPLTQRNDQIADTPTGTNWRAGPCGAAKE